MSKTTPTVDPRIAMLGAVDPQPVIVAGAKAKFFLLPLTGAGELTLFAHEADRSAVGYTNQLHLLLALTICDEQGNRLFRDDEAEVVSQLPTPVIKALSAKALAIAGLGAEPDEDAKKN